MPNILKLTAVVTAVDILTPVRLNKTPLLGGDGREAKYSIPTLPLTSVFKLQGHPSQSATEPAEADTGWADIATINATAAQAGEIADLPGWIRVNVTTADADGPDVAVYLEGVQ